MNIFEPLIDKLSPTRVALVFIAAASEPELGLGQAPRADFLRRYHRRQVLLADARRSANIAICPVESDMCAAQVRPIDAS